jgi:uncharacterized membrane protein YdbT with pleckstrin-like domain
VRRLGDPPPEIYADEPVVFESGPHWMAYDTTLYMVLGTAIIVLLTWLLAPEYLRFVLLPIAAVLIRIAMDLPRFWRFSIVVTTRRVFVNVGTMRDIYHTIHLKHVRSVEARTNNLGRLLRYGEVELDLEGMSPDGEVHKGTYLLDYVRRPVELKEAIADSVALLMLEESTTQLANDAEEEDVPV